MDLSKMMGLFNDNQLNKLKNAKIAIFGLGGVGGYALEALTRSGIGYFYLIDGDIIESSNINRQLLALNSTIGLKKVQVAKQRVKEINPDAKIETLFEMVKPDKNGRLNLLLLEKIDAIVDATDDVPLKASLALEAEIREIFIISSGGTANILDAPQFEITDIYKTKNCPLCRSLRHSVKKLAVKKLPILCSRNGNIHHLKNVSSTPWAPGVAGLMIASYLIQNLLKEQ